MPKLLQTMRIFALVLALSHCASGRRVQFAPIGAPATSWHVVHVALPRLASGAAMVDAEECVPVVPYFCNEEGCWIGTDEDLPPPEALKEGQKYCEEPAVKAVKKAAEKRPIAPTGLFAPAVLGAKKVMGEKELNKFRAEVIAQHTKVITAFVDTSDSKFGQIVLRRLFEAADQDDNGTLDKEEIQDALNALGFTFMKDKEIKQIFKRGDTNKDEVIDFEEFVKETPKTLRVSLVKLAKKNGHDLGFLA
jgi:hypothetical protein